ncbi:hypothetical protein [Marivirga harenae]|uniref:hypothetical protein n=1 Tax=Marivirga harenae TaxID=2010992 RepID=UPI0026DF0AEF|nr:hypothetical protein [Marivirga harenae]WKV12187.1 hypothetical protein Q3Y49_18480 [Marivirga harenae]
MSRKDKSEIKEHIPAQNLFAGYSSEYKNNRIVVPSCKDCNNGTSDIDEEFRNFIGVMSNSEELDQISKNTTKSMITLKKEFERLTLDENGNIIGVKFNDRQIKDNHCKIFKGLYYHQYSQPLPQDYKVEATFDPTEYTQMCVHYLQGNFKWDHSGHPEVFKYIIQPFRENLNNPEKKNLQMSSEDSVIVGLLVYNVHHACIVLASNNI